MAITYQGQNYCAGSEVVAGSPAVINVELGFEPAWVKVWNPSNDAMMEWTPAIGAGMARITPETKNGLITTTGCAMGTTKDQVANIAYLIGIAGLRYQVAAVAAGTAPTATTIPQNKWGLFGFEVAADGTIDKGADAAGNAAGYASEALAIAALPAASANHLITHYVTVMSVNAAGFVGATTEFDHADVTANFYSVDLVGYTQTNGITVLNAAAGDTVTGFKIGVHTSIQIAGNTLYWEAGR